MKSRYSLLAAAVLPAIAIAATAPQQRGAIASDGASISVATDRGTLRVTPITDDIFRITVIPDTMDGYRYLPSQAVVLTPQRSNVNVSASPSSVVIASPSTTVSIDRHTGLATFLDSTGRLLISEARGLDNRRDSKVISLAAPAGQRFFGAGERGHSLDLRGDTLVMYNRQNYGYTGTDPRISQMNITMPYFASDAGYGILVDDHNQATLILGDTIRYTSDNPPSLLSYYFINGHGTLAGTTSRFTALTGRQDMPPFWSLGYITSRYGYHNRQETLGAVDTLRRHGYPVDGIVLDLYWYGKETDMGRFEWNATQFPDHREMLDSLRRQGVKTVIISQPYINKIGALDNYNTLRAAGLLTCDAQGQPADVTTWVGEAGMLDISNPATRQWLAARYASLTADGVEGWWGDLGEPEVHPSGIVHHNGMTTEQYHNVYGNEWSRIVYDMMREQYPDRRIMTLMRGGTTGLQRYDVFPWSTDVSRSWGGFQPQVKIMLGAGLSGLGYMSSDIGGFAVDPAHPTDAELYVRWLQMGAFTPTLRTHAQLKPEPYCYPQYEDICRRFIKMRYEWLPYNYTLAYENAAMGYPLARPLDFSTGEASHAGITDEYLWGDEVLVAPVMRKGARSRRVTFPDGEWVDWNNPLRRFRGGTTTTVSAPLSQMPLFVRRGAFIPQYTRPIEHTEQYDPAYLTVRYFPAAEETSYTLYDDDRTSPTSLQDGAYRLVTFTGKQDGGETRICISSEGKGYEAMPQTVHVTLEVTGIARKPRSVTVNGTAAEGWKYDARTRTVTITADHTDAGTTVVMR